MDETAIVILAGGEGLRMGGDKPLRLWRGQRLIDRALELAHSYGEDVAIAVRKTGQFDLPGHTLVFDAPDIEGPLGGLEAAMNYARMRGKARVLTIACDTPLLPGNLLSALSGAMKDGARVVLAQSHGQLHPVCGLWDVALAPALRAYHGEGRSSLRGFAHAQGAVIVDWGAPAPDPFVNANTPGDLAKLESP